MPTSLRDGRRLTGYVTGAHDQQSVAPAQIHRHSLYDDGMDDYHNHPIDDDYDDDMDDEDEDESVGSVLSIPDPNIDFDLVYALHTFAATVEGQASVVKGDALTLLDDSNSYWWLVKVLKTSEVGYIPAENIETPYERLARLNSHRNIELTQRDIQDAFPAPPSTKPKSNKKVKLAKGVKFQAQVIFGSSDDEDFEEEFEEWQETIRTDSDTDDLDDTTDSDDDDDYYDDVRLYGSTGGYDYGQSSVDNYARSHHQQQQQQQQQYAQPTSNHHQQQQQQQQQPYPTAQQQQQQRGGNMPFRDTLDLEATETIKFSLTPEVARDTHESGNQYREMSYGDPQSKASKLESILAGDGSSPPASSSSSSAGPPVNEQRRGSKDKKEKGALRKLFSRNKDGKDKKQRKGSMDKQTPIITVGDQVISSETASLSSQSTGYSDRDRASSIDSSSHMHMHHHQQYHYSHQQQQPRDAHPPQQQRQSEPAATAQQQQQQPAMLKIYAGNVRFGAEFKIANTYPNTTAADLIQHALHTFDIQNHQPSANADAHLDYFLVVRGVDGDEYTLVPNDRPLTIYSSLTAHLNTPMPSLKKARRISALMGASDSAHIGGPKEGAEEIQEEVRFYLYTKAKRPEDGHMSIKVSLFASEIGGNTSILKFDQTRVDKLVTVPIHASVGDVTALVLDKFHILNGIVDGPDAEEKAQSLRLRGAEDQAIRYQLSVSKQGQEMMLAPTVDISSAFGDNLPPVVHRRNSSNPDRASIASLSSVITPSPQPDETFFILRRSDRQKEDASSQQASPAPVRPPRPTRQDTPMPRGTPSPANGPVPDVPSSSGNNVHPLAISTTTTADQEQQQGQVMYDEPESAVDVLMKLDQALDNLAHTRNSNEPLTEAIVASSINNSRDMLQQTTMHGDDGDADDKKEHQQQQQRAWDMESDIDAPPSIIEHDHHHHQQPIEESDHHHQQSPPPMDGKSSRRTPVDSMLFCEEFGMNELMVLIRGAVRYAEEQEQSTKTHKHPPIRSEISEVFKDSQQRLEQLEKELDRLMADAVRVYS